MGTPKLVVKAPMLVVRKLASLANSNQARALVSLDNSNQANTAQLKASTLSSKATPTGISTVKWLEYLVQLVRLV